MTQVTAMLWSPALKEHKRGRTDHYLVDVAHVRTAWAEGPRQVKAWPDDEGRWREVETRCAGSPLPWHLGTAAHGLLRGVTRQYGSSPGRWSGP